jgi:hypothetical protein
MHSIKHDQPNPHKPQQSLPPMPPPSPRYSPRTHLPIASVTAASGVLEGEGAAGGDADIRVMVDELGYSLAEARKVGVR